MTTKRELMAEIDAAWSDLNVAIERLSESQLTTSQDEQGWTGKDHLIHLAAWERSMVYFLQSKPREDGLGVPRSLYMEGGFDAINAEIQRQQRDVPLTEVMAELRAVHAQLLRLLQPLTDADLQLRYRHYLPNEPGEGDGPRAIDLLYGNTANHFREHLAWMQALIET